MSKKATDIVAYITWIGWIVAFCAGTKQESKFHLNQALVIWLGFIVLGDFVSDSYCSLCGRNM